MILYISELQKEHLHILHSYSVPVLVDFCKLAIDYLNNGANPKKYSIAAGKLEVHSDDIQNVVSALVYLLVEACKHNLSQADYRLSLSIARFSDEHQDVLVKLYNTKKTELSNALSKLQQRDFNYQDLEWRFEVEVATKNVDEQIKPTITMDLILQTPKPLYQDSEVDKNSTSTVTSGNVTKNKILLELNNSTDDAKTASQCQSVITHKLMQCDLPNLMNLTNKLDQALQESKSQHIRKIQRALQKKIDY